MRVRIVSGPGLVVVATLTACISMAAATTAAEPLERRFLVVAGAQDVREISISQTQVQVAYTVELEYPAHAIGEPQWARLRAAGWTRCRSQDPGQESANADWVSFEDWSGTPKQTIHQHLSRWAKDDRLIMITLRYVSPVSRSGQGGKPENTRQLVNVAFEDVHGREMAEWLQLDCSWANMVACQTCPRRGLECLMSAGHSACAAFRPKFIQALPLASQNRRGTGKNRARSVRSGR